MSQDIDDLVPGSGATRTSKRGKEWWVYGRRLDSEIEYLLDGIEFESEQEGLDTIVHLRKLQRAGRL